MPTILAYTPAELAAVAPPAKWICEPWVAAGSVTELSGKMKKSGKTTWLLHLCRAICRGEEFLGKPVLHGPVVYMTEQAGRSFVQALEQAQMLDLGNFRCVLWSEVAGYDWPTLMRGVTDLLEDTHAVMLVVDTLPHFTLAGDGAENDAGAMLAAIQPIMLATARLGIGALVVRHIRKAGGSVGENARGSTAGGGAVDIILSLARAGGADRNRRVITALGRFPELPADPVSVTYLPESACYEFSTQAKELRAARADLYKLQRVEKRNTLRGQLLGIFGTDLREYTLPLLLRAVGPKVSRSGVLRVLGDLSAQGLIVVKPPIKGSRAKRYQSLGRPTQLALKAYDDLAVASALHAKLEAGEVRVDPDEESGDDGDFFDDDDNFVVDAGDEEV